MSNSNKINLMDLTIDETCRLMEEIGEPKFRGRQIYKWVSGGCPDFEAMTNISKGLRQKLSDISHTGLLKIERKLVSSVDNTIKYLFMLADGNVIESVVMEYNYGNTICVSSQVGCKMGCKFCASTIAGFSRDLTAGEMLGQIITASADSGIKISNVVIMGIGEPLDNYDNVIKFLRLANSPEGLNIGNRHFSLSTSGIVPQIYRLAREQIPLTLAISLHAANDPDRSSIMPVNRKYSIDKLIEACKIYTKETGRRITFEYAMIKGVNDSLKHAGELSELLKGMLCHVNLIPVNTVEETGFTKSSRESIDSFMKVLERRGIEVTVRRELGSDINAACGQLRKSAVKAERANDEPDRE